jgi:hypothetical protein
MSRMDWFRKAAPAVEPQATPEDYLREADADLRAAEVEFAQAHLEVNRYYTTHREFLPVVDVAGKTVLNIRPPSPELAELLSRENRSIQARNQAMARRAELRKLYQPETQFVAGVLVRTKDETREGVTHGVKTW